MSKEGRTHKEPYSSSLHGNKIGKGKEKGKGKRKRKESEWGR